MTETKTQADYTLEELWEKGTPTLLERTPTPGDTYEVGPGLVGRLPYPSLEARQADRKIRQEMIGKIFREDAESDDFALLDAKRKKRLLENADEGEDTSDLPSMEELNERIEELEEKGAQMPFRQDVTTQEGNQAITGANCKRAARILEFEKDVEPSDIVPEMAAVFTSHFTALAPGTQNGQKQS